MMPDPTAAPLGAEVKSSSRYGPRTIRGPTSLLESEFIEWRRRIDEYCQPSGPFGEEESGVAVKDHHR